MTDHPAEAEGASIFADAPEWERWLADHHDTRQAVWIRIAKKGSAMRSVSAAEATEVALCFGWIDSHRKSLDETWFLQKFTPRRARSAWSRVNVDRVEALTAAGRMREPGLAQVAAAKSDGRWDAAYESQRTATVPPDLAAALATSAEATEAFESLGRSDRYALILRLLKARTPEQRASHLARIVAMLEAGERPQATSARSAPG
ncbi:MAG: YdeI/OmpD-associated family protein [Chloroflexota bacterium]